LHISVFLPDVANKLSHRLLSPRPTTRNQFSMAQDHITRGN